MKKAIIFDIDGTLSDPSHRIHLYKAGKYDEFNASCHLDMPIKTICELCHVLSRNKDIDIIFLTGRTDINAEKTRKWIETYIKPKYGYKLIMRKYGDTRPSTITKKEAYEDIKQEFNVIMAFDDRKDIISMWKTLNIICFHIE